MSIEAPGVQACVQAKQGSFFLDVELGLPGNGLSALIGRSGSGKSTLLRWMAGLLEAQKGYLKVGTEVWEDLSRSVRVPTHERAIGYVPQSAGLFSHLSVRENLVYGKKRISKTSTSLDLSSVVALMGLEPLLKRSVSSLSGGEKQRIAIARSLLVAPKLLLFDEPLTGLDPESKAEIISYLKTLKSEFGIPMIYVTHAPEEVRQLADHQMRLTAGKISGHKVISIEAQQFCPRCSSLMDSLASERAVAPPLSE